jgi:hypothetical protein
VSFDDGERWQSLSLNLPDTQVSDIVVEDHDLVIATHGRSMWVLDNIAPIRQLTPEVARTTALYLFAPEEATRRPRPVAIDYFLKNKADKVQIDILDAQGQLVRSFTGPQEKKSTDGEDDDGGEGRGAPPPVGVDAGLNRFVWDMRYAGATTFPGEIMWGAQPGQGPLAVPGNYQVRVTAGGQTATQPFRIGMDPRVKVTRAELQEQFDLALKVRDRVSAADQAVIAVRKLRDQVNERLEKAKYAERDRARKPMTTALENLKEKLTGVEEAVYQVKNRSGQDPLNFPIKLNNKIAHLSSVIEGADARPTDQTYAAFKELSGELQTQLDHLDEAVNKDVPATNKLLSGKKIPAINVDEAAGVKKKPSE